MTRLFSFTVHKAPWKHIMSWKYSTDFVEKSMSEQSKSEIKAAQKIGVLVYTNSWFSSCTKAHHQKLSYVIKIHYQLNATRRYLDKETIIRGGKYHRFWFCCSAVGHFIQCSVCLLSSSFYDIRFRRSLCRTFIPALLELTSNARSSCASSYYSAESDRTFYYCPLLGQERCFELY